MSRITKKRILKIKKKPGIRDCRIIENGKAP